ncbi:MAG: dethiobiotin synthase, partial [Nitrospiraceae bacterium]
YELVIVEGAGGIMVPVYKKYLFLDLIRDLNIPVIVVARPGLGTVNHTLMTIAAARSNGLEVLGVVINESMKTRKGLPEKTNPGLIEQLGGVPVLGNVNYSAARDRSVKKEIQKIGNKLLSSYV